VATGGSGASSSQKGAKRTEGQFPGGPPSSAVAAAAAAAIATGAGMGADALPGAQSVAADLANPLPAMAAAGHPSPHGGPEMAGAALAAAARGTEQQGKQQHLALQRYVRTRPLNPPHAWGMGARVEDAHRVVQVSDERVTRATSLGGQQRLGDQPPGAAPCACS